MANIKKLTLDWSQTGVTIYCIIRREVDEYLLDDSDGNFVYGPADPYLSMAEDAIIKGRYEVEESRQAWDNGLYNIICYKQSGGSPSPSSDTIVGSEEMYIVGDLEVNQLESMVKMLGLVLENHVEDDITRNAYGAKITSILYVYDTAANATTHDKTTGLLYTYNVTIGYDGNNRLSSLKVIKN